MTPPLPEEYRHPPFDEDCAPRQLLRLLSGKWTTMILHSLHLLGGHARPTQLMRAIPGLSKKMMTQTLKELEQRQWVYRDIEQVMPPIVEYRLTELGQLFVEPIEMLYQWGIAHSEALNKACSSEKP
ncbi:helix-turn-helix domain-containing protein [Zymomonas sp.]|uniref:winged helix-turn-helix transcriptional regulator n=1 Tax=Zymomonas sp. TaxID=2068624 RepID=UPI0025F8B43A|nr:helix-turn-helix domain-containing protein [Zymomonas sp.]MCA1956609.1 helix-turn-helix transcriptional regulator [Zymomonas sp.]